MLEKDAMNELTLASLDRLLAIAECDTVKGRLAADFILKWWNPESLLEIDPSMSDDESRVAFYFVAGSGGACAYPEDRRPQIEALIRRWRSEAWAKTHT